MSIDRFIAETQRSFSGVPSNDDIPRDEMLLAEGLARFITCFSFPYDVADEIADSIGVVGTSVHDCAWSGAYDATCGEQDDSECASDMDAYAAGAALAMALEEP